jgi:hypothetical protein
MKNTLESTRAKLIKRPSHIALNHQISHLFPRKILTDLLTHFRSTMIMGCIIVYAFIACKAPEQCNGICRSEIEDFLAETMCKTNDQTVEVDQCHPISLFLPRVISTHHQLNFSELITDHQLDPFTDALDVQWSLYRHEEHIYSQVSPSLDLAVLNGLFDTPVVLRLEIKSLVADPQTKGSHHENPCELSSDYVQKILLVDEIEAQDHQRLLAKLNYQDKSYQFSVWGEEVIYFDPGQNLSDGFKERSSALGVPSFDKEGLSSSTLPADQTLSLGTGGSVVLRLSESISDGEGVDIGVFENSFNGTFIEYAYVEVSSDGQHFVRFPNLTFSDDRLHAFGEITSYQSIGLAGVGKAGTPTGFDLSELYNHPKVIDGLVDLNLIYYVKVIDIMGDHSALDSLGRPIADPYPTQYSAGFDLDAVGAKPIKQISCIP